MKHLLTKHNKVLLLELIRTDFKLRYQGSFLGYLWALLKPLFLFAILYAVFGLGLKLNSGIPNYPVYLLVGIVLWGFFSDATKQGMSSIVSRGELIRKIKFPKYIIVVSSTVSAFINFLFNLLVIFFFMFLTKSEVQPLAFVLFPLLILELYIFSLAIAFYLSALNVKYRDAEYIWDILLQGGFYATPIFYSLSLVAKQHPQIAQAMLFSPIAQIIQDVRSLLVTPETITMYSLSHHFAYYVVPFIFVILSMIMAARYFRKKSARFAEDI